MASSNYYGAEQTKMADYGYGDDDPYSFGGYSATQQPMSAGGADNETQRRRSPPTGTSILRNVSIHAVAQKSGGV